MIKKLLALLLSLVLIFGFAGCSYNNVNNEKGNQDKETKEEKKVNREDNVKNVAKAFMDSYIDFDTEGLKETVKDVGKLPKSLQNGVSEATIIGRTGKDLEGFEEEVSKITEAMIETIKSEFSYKFKDVKENNGYYVFTVVVTAPDFEDFKMEKLFTRKEANKLKLALAESGKISDDMTEEEKSEKFKSAYIDAIKTAIGETDFSSDLKDHEARIAVVEDGDYWVVDAKKSSLKKLANLYN